MENSEAKLTSWAVAGYLGYASGTFGDGESIPERSMSSIPLRIFGGYRWNWFQAGLSAEYAQNTQVTDPETVNDQNAEGSSAVAALELQWIGQKWGVSAVYRGLSTYTFSNSGISGQSVRYSGSGYSINILRTIRKKVGLYVEATFDSFDRTDSQNLQPPVKMSKYGVGVIFSNFWN